MQLVILFLASLLAGGLLAHYIVRRMMQRWPESAYQRERELMDQIGRERIAHHEEHLSLLRALVDAERAKTE